MDIAKCFGCQDLYDIQRWYLPVKHPPLPPLCSYKLDQIRDRKGGVFNQGILEVL